MSVACQPTDGLLLLLQAAKTIDTEFEPHTKPSHRSTYVSWKHRPSQRNCYDSKYSVHSNFGYAASKRPITTTRRAHLRNCVELLKKCLAFDNDAPRITTLSVLKKAVSSIKYLHQRNQNLETQEEREKQRSIRLIKRQLILKKRREEKRNKSKCWRERNRNSSECSINTTSSEDSEIDAHLRNGVRPDYMASFGQASPNRHIFNTVSGNTAYVLNGVKRTPPMAAKSRPPSGLDAFDASSLDSGFEELNTRSQSASPDNPSGNLHYIARSPCHNSTCLK